MRPRQNAVGLTTLIALSVALTPTSPATAAEQSTLQCGANVSIYRVTEAGEMLLYQHADPENGTQSWGTRLEKSAAAFTRFHPADPGQISRASLA